VRALREAVEESIYGGRVFVLGTTSVGPIVDSLISGVGIVDAAAGVELGSCPSNQRGRFVPSCSAFSSSRLAT